MLATLDPGVASRYPIHSMHQRHIMVVWVKTWSWLMIISSTSCRWVLELYTSNYCYYTNGVNMHYFINAICPLVVTGHSLKIIFPVGVTPSCILILHTLTRPWHSSKRMLSLATPRNMRRLKLGQLTDWESNVIGTNWRKGNVSGRCSHT